MRENEICVFVNALPQTIERMKGRVSQSMTQIEIHSKTEKGVKITTRARKTDMGSNPVSILATKIRLPRQEGSISSQALEFERPEFQISNTEFDTLAAYCDICHKKRRFSYQLDDDVVAEIDVYQTKDNDFYPIVKVDIENGKESNFDFYLEELREKYGIVFDSIVNPPGTDSESIGNDITELMTVIYNLKHSA